MAAELKRYIPELDWDHGDCFATMTENQHGDYVRFADVEAYTQAAIAAAMMGAADIARHEGDLIAKRTGDLENDEAITARGIAELIVSAIPTDATAALEAVKAQVRDDTVRSAAIAAGNAIVRLATNVDPDNSPLRKQMLRVKMEKAVKAAFTRDA